MERETYILEKQSATLPWQVFYGDQYLAAFCHYHDARKFYDLVIKDTSGRYFG